MPLNITRLHAKIEELSNAVQSAMVQAIESQPMVAQGLVPNSTAAVLAAARKEGTTVIFH